MRLIIEDYEGATTVVPLSARSVTIGRREGNTIRLTERNISRQHAKLELVDDTWSIEDLGSYNGVRINGVVTKGRVALRVRDVVQLGDYRLILADDAGARAEGASAEAANDATDRVSRSSSDLPRVSREGAPMAGADEPANDSTSGAAKTVARRPTPRPEVPTTIPGGAAKPAAVPSQGTGLGGPGVPTWPQVTSAQADEAPAERSPKGKGGLWAVLLLLGAAGGGGAYFLTRPSAPVPTSPVVAERPPARVVPPPPPSPVVEPSPTPAGPPPTPSEPVPMAAGATGEGGGVAVPAGDGSAEPTGLRVEDSEAPGSPAVRDTGRSAAGRASGGGRGRGRDAPTAQTRGAEAPAVAQKEVASPAKPPPPPSGAEGEIAENLLREARKASLTGNSAKAYALAEKSFDLRGGSAALEVMGVAACKMGDVGKAKSVHARLPGPKKASLVELCASRGVKL